MSQNITLTTNLSGLISSASVSAGNTMGWDADISTAVPIQDFDEFHLPVGASRLLTQVNITSGSPTPPSITFCFWTSLVVPPASVN